MKKLVIAGGTGYLGKACVAYFSTKYDTIVVLSRKKRPTLGNVRYAQWDAEQLGPWRAHLNDCHTLINMTGRSVDCRYTETNKKVILNSRINSTEVLGAAIGMAKNPPQVWLNSSTATIYRHSLNMEMDERSGEIGEGFSVEVAKAWEKAFFSQQTPRTRKVALRTSIVLGGNGGALVPIKNLAKIGFGGRQGPGNQKFSWIHIQDFVRSLEFLIDSPNLSGPVNIVSPKPVTNAELMRTVRKAVGFPFGFPLPKLLLEIGARIIRTETELVLKSRNVIPRLLLEHGFVFHHDTLETTLKSSV